MTEEKEDGKMRHERPEHQHNQVLRLMAEQNETQRQLPQTLLKIVESLYNLPSKVSWEH